MKRGTGRGFTIVEVIIVIVVMVILLVLGTVSLGNLQANARDSEREQDVATIMRGLDLRYNKGNDTYASRSGTSASSLRGSYPSTDELNDILSNDYLSDALPGVSNESATSPSNGKLVAICTKDGECSGGKNQVYRIQPLLLPNLDNYVYYPLDSNNQICKVGPCVRFNMYYQAETKVTNEPTYTNTVLNNTMVTKSKHQ